MAYSVPKLTDFSARGAGARGGGDACCVRARAQLCSVRIRSEFDEFKIRWMGRKNGLLTQANEFWLKSRPPDRKRDVGQRLNAIKAEVEKYKGLQRSKRVSDVNSKA